MKINFFSLKQAIILSSFWVLSCKPDASLYTAPTTDPDDLTKISYTPHLIDLKIPNDFPKIDLPTDNNQSEEGIALGKMLFYDPIMSLDSSISCSSCHLPEGGFTDNKALSAGVKGTLGQRSAMALANVAFFQKGLFWDGRVKTLEEQAEKPVEDMNEMHEIWDNVLLKLRKHPKYPTFFRQAFAINSKTQITKTLAAKALAQFERTLISNNSKYDRVRRGELFFNDAELNGYIMYFNADASLPDAQCGHCHNGPILTSNDYFNNGIDAVSTLNDFKDKGLGKFTGKLFDNGKFRAPSLRNIALTAPYMHDGRFKTLPEVINHYASGGHYAENLDPLIQQVKLNDKQKSDLLAFLNTLTDTTFVKNTAFQSPFR